MIAGFAKSFENFNYVVSAVLTPLFLVAGTFFPLGGFPRWVQVLAAFNPLHQTSSSSATRCCSASSGSIWLRVGVPRHLRAAHVADRDPRDGTEADRLSEPEFRIEPWGEGDLPLLERLLGDPAMMEHLGGPESPEKIAERQERYIGLDGEGPDKMFKIVEAATGESVGSVGYWERDWLGGQVYETGLVGAPRVPGPRDRHDRDGAGDRARPRRGQAPLPATRIPRCRERPVERDLPQARLRAPRRARTSSTRRGAGTSCTATTGGSTSSALPASRENPSFLYSLGAAT